MQVDREAVVAVRITIVMPAHNVGPWVERGVRSALEQSLPSLEVVAVENGSTDDTAARLAALAAADARVRLLRVPRALGPGAARNVALDAARGAWVTFLDADDSFAPDRLRRLLAATEDSGVAVVADNQRLIAADGTVLGPMWPDRRRAERVDAAAFVRGNRWGGGFGLGYAKPLIRRDRIETPRLRFDPRLRVGEDFQFLLALLARGEEMLLLPEALYDYSLRPASLSRSLSLADQEAMLAAAAAARDGAPGPVAAALDAHLRALGLAVEHRRIVEAVKAGRPLAALAKVARRPAVLPLVVRYGRESIARRLPGRRAPAADMAAPPASAPPLAAYFGPDCTDSGVIRRVVSLQQEGLRVVGFTFRRRRFNRDYRPEWDDVPLGPVREAALGRRVLALLRALPVVTARRRTLRRAAFLYARNLDLAVLALAARWLAGARAPLVYEVMDVHRSLVGTGPRARMMRWAERRVLARTRLLVVTSPAYVSRYFAPVQGYRGQWFLLENKLSGAQLRAGAARAIGDRAAAEVAALRGENGRLVIGWFGTLRCPHSLDMLAQLCRALPDRVAVYLRGYPTEIALETFLAELRRHPNMAYGGEYRSPDDLAAIYGAVDLAWCFDYYDAGTNSRWLLPNRLYDAGYHNVPILAEASTETGRAVERLGLGWTFAPPVVPALARFFRRTDAAAVRRCRQRMAALPRRLFRDDDDTARLLRTLIEAPQRPSTEAAAAPAAAVRPLTAGDHQPVGDGTSGQDA